MNTIGDMQNEKYFYSHCNGFEYKHVYEKVKKLANVCNIKRTRRDYIIDDLVQKVEN